MQMSQKNGQSRDIRFLVLQPTVACMWCSRLRVTFLSRRDEVDAGAKPIISH